MIPPSSENAVAKKRTDLQPDRLVHYLGRKWTKHPIDAATDGEPVCIGSNDVGRELDPPPALRAMTEPEGAIQIKQAAEGAGGWGCSRVLGVRNNIAIDVMHCATDPADQGVAVFNAIAANIEKS
mgnify:CR=1 FL=1